MNFLALFLGLGVERLLTQLFHLREFRWLDPLFDWGFSKLSRTNKWIATAGVIAVALITIIPVLIAAYVLEGTLRDIPYFLFAVLVLLFSLGPRDLLNEGNEFCGALNSDDVEKAKAIARDVVETGDDSAVLVRMDEAVYQQANNRIYSVVFWFVVLGPVGAWMFRCVDLMRHRASYELNRLSHETTQKITAEPIGAAEKTIFYLHSLLAWVPSRLLVLGYVLAGNFDTAIAGIKAYYASGEVNHLSTDVLKWAGRGASGYAKSEPDESVEISGKRAAAAITLVRRTLWLIWCPALALLTLSDSLL